MVLCAKIGLKQIQGHSRKYVRQFGSNLNENPLTTFWSFPQMLEFSHICTQKLLVEPFIATRTWPGPDVQQPQRKGLNKGVLTTVSGQTQKIEHCQKKNISYPTTNFRELCHMWISGNVMKLGFLPLFLNDLFGWQGWSNGSGVDKDTSSRWSQCWQVWPLTQLPSVSARCKKPMWMKRRISSCASKISNLVFRASRCDSVLSLPWIQTADTQVSILGDKVIYRPVRRFKILIWIWECLKHEWPPNKEMANLVETCLTQSISTHAQPTHSIRTHTHTQIALSKPPNNTLKPYMHVTPPGNFQSYCWWKKACTSWYGKHHII